jgi:proline dehydrogenase
MRELLQEAAREGLEVLISMEGSESTSEILNIHRILSEEFPNVGITIQAYLHRTSEDLKTVLERQGKVGLVKCAYGESSKLAIDRSSMELTRKYLGHLRTILKEGHKVSIATHDPIILQESQKLTAEEKVDNESIEFEMLYGVTPERLETIKNREFRTRIYLP